MVVQGFVGLDMLRNHGPKIIIEGKPAFPASPWGAPMLKTTAWEVTLKAGKLMYGPTD